MGFLYALLLTLGLIPAHAQKSLSAPTFQANVRPVLNGIIHDYYQMISLFPYFPKEMIEVLSHLNELTVLKVNLIQDCPGTMDVKCLTTIDDLKGKLSSLEMEVQGTISHLKLPPSLYISTQEGLRFLYQVDGKMLEAKGILANTSLMIKADVKHNNKSYPMVKLLDEITDLASLGVASFIPHPYQEDFRHFYFNFINPIQTEISKSQNFEYMNRNITYLNFALNLLNMNLTKRNKKTPEGMGPYLAAMHNRWNGILRYYY